MKALRTGPLPVGSKNSSQTQRLLTCSLCGSPATAILADRMNSVEGSVRADSLLDMTNKEILEELTSQGVCRVQRLRSREKAKWGPNPTIRISFHG